jgi:hypothetical protein
MGSWTGSVVFTISSDSVMGMQLTSFTFTGRGGASRR